MSTVSTATSAIKPVSRLKHFSSCFFRCQQCQWWNRSKKKLMYNFLRSMVSTAPSLIKPVSCSKYFSSRLFRRQQCQRWNTKKVGWCIISWCQRCQRHHQQVSQYLFWNISLNVFSDVNSEVQEKKWLMYNFFYVYGLKGNISN